MLTDHPIPACTFILPVVSFMEKELISGLILFYEYTIFLLSVLSISIYLVVATF